MFRYMFLTFTFLVYCAVNLAWVTRYYLILKVLKRILCSNNPIIAKPKVRMCPLD